MNQVFYIWTLNVTFFSTLLFTRGFEGKIISSLSWSYSTRNMIAYTFNPFTFIITLVLYLTFAFLIYAFYFCKYFLILYTLFYSFMTLFFAFFPFLLIALKLCGLVLNLVISFPSSFYMLLTQFFFSFLCGTRASHC